MGPQTLVGPRVISLRPGFQPSKPGTQRLQLSALLEDDFVLDLNGALEEGELHFQLDQCGGFA